MIDKNKITIDSLINFDPFFFLKTKTIIIFFWFIKCIPEIINNSPLFKILMQMKKERERIINI